MKLRLKISLLALVAGTSLNATAAELTDVLQEDAVRFTALLKSPMPERRIEGVQGLSQMKHWPAEDAIARLLDDGNSDGAPVLRREALQALTRLGSARSISKLIDAVASSNWELRENARLALERMTAHDCADCSAEQWRAWWNGSTLAQKQQELLAIAKAKHTNAPPQAAPPTVMRRGRRVRPLPASIVPPACAERREALRALVHLADPAIESSLLALLAQPQTPPLDPDERGFLCEALDRVGTEKAVLVLAAQRSDAAAWALGRIGGTEAERALINFPPTLGTLLALDRLHSTNAAHLLPFLVQNMGQITFRGQPDDVMNDELQPIQRVGVNLIRRAGLAPLFTEAVLQELEDTMKPAITHGARPAIPSSWQPLLSGMRSELKPGFVREDGTTTSQPLVTVCYMADDPALAKRMVPLLNHPAFVVRVYVALTLGRLRATDAFSALTNIINQGYAFSDSTALASGKHFDQSQTVRWKGFLCMALGRMGGETARAELERYASEPGRTRDIRYSSVVGLRFIASPQSLPVLQKVAEQDVIWMVRDEARRTVEYISTVAAETTATQQAKVER